MWTVGEGLLSKFTIEERRYLKQLVQEAIVRRFTNNEVIVHIEKELGKNITIKQVTRIKKNIKNEASSWISSLAKTDHVYFNEYKLRIHELESNQKELWRLYYESNTNTTQKIMIQEKLAKITIYLTQLYDVLPVINAVMPAEDMNSAASSAVFPPASTTLGTLNVMH
ncbi:hypothetical protein BH18THE2_BH18THE2_29420 [soil metagenome]